MICTAHQMLFDDQIKMNEMRGACSSYWGQERCIQVFSGETLEEETS
jgi:hypothetical protein